MPCAVTTAYGCSASTEQVRQNEAQALSALAPLPPDCRAYEQVSPVAKNDVDALGTASIVQASPNGDRVVFFAEAPFSRTTGAAQLPTYLGTRDPGDRDWSTQDLEALVPPAGIEFVRGVTAELGKTIVKVQSEQSIPVCEPTVVVCGLLGEANAYIHNSTTGAFEFLTALGKHDIGFSDATPNGSQILFETDAKLIPAAAAGAVNLYEWNEAKPRTERISLAGVLPDGTAPRMGSNSGPGGPAVGPQGRPFLPEAMWRFYTQNTISEDGSRIFFTSNATGRIYMRDTVAGKTTQISGTSERPRREEEEIVTGTGTITSSSTTIENVSASSGTFTIGSTISGAGIPAGVTITAIEEGGKKIQISKGATETKTGVELKSRNPVETEPAFWRGASQDGFFVYYTEEGELFRFNVEKFLTSGEPEEEALAGARERLTTGAEGVFGLLGLPKEGDSYVYFAAPGVLTSNENGSKEKAVKGGANVYEWHEGVLIFVATLMMPEPGQQRDEANWRGWTNYVNEPVGPSGGAKSSRVSSAGQYLLFSSTKQLTKYQNNGAIEFYLLNGAKPLSVSNPRCVSCNPTGVPATSGAHLTKRNTTLIAEPELRNGFMTHNLSSNGHRVFFETEEALVPGDANMNNDVYEWEADGEGSCEDEAQNGGCLYLISTGQGGEGAYFGDASTNGNDVFFFTRQSLVGQDLDNNVDLYNARVEGGIPSQDPTQVQSLCEEEIKCRGAGLSEPPAFGVPATAALVGAGNVIQSPSGSSPAKPRRGEGHGQKLATALKRCRSEAKSKRKNCERSARRRYGAGKPRVRKIGRRGARR